MSVWSSLSFVVLASVYLLFGHSSEFTGSFLVKILPLLVLLVLVLRQPGLPRFLPVALLLSMLGDVLLALDGQKLFVYGLAAFLCSHLAYLQAMRPWLRFRAWWLLPYAGVAALVMTPMWSGLGAMTLPVLAYMAVILAMSVSTWCSSARNPWLIAGGLLFISSDSLLGLNKFWQPLPAAGWLIMLTYYAAQYALVRGFLQAREQSSLPADDQSLPK
jgi:uncharacterized membrane protein YhhN